VTRSSTLQQTARPAPAVVHGVVRSAGQPLAPAVRESLEPRFGQDFSRVRVHADGTAADSARAVHAIAYTVGEHVVFGAGRYRPGDRAGLPLLVHELAHVSQAGNGSAIGTAGITDADITVGRDDDAAEKAAAEAAARVAGGHPGPIAPSPVSGGPVLRRFSESEHQRIGDAAYTEAFDETRSGGDAGRGAGVDPDLAGELRQLRFQPGATAVYGYGQMVAIADDIASFDLLEQQQNERRDVRIPLLSPVWDWLGDTAHYLDLAARNTAHFHPHNWRTWQPWHWRALQLMQRAFDTRGRAERMRGEMADLLRQFGRAERRARALISRGDAPGGGGPASDAALQRALTDMQALIAGARQAAERSRALRVEAGTLAVEAMAMNGFADHFLTDAFAAGHIVTPRQELLTEYSTEFLGLVPVGGVLQCANIPSLAWHDLDNMSGVRVDNLRGEEWTTYGDDYADVDPDRPPGGRTLSPTMKHVVAATAESVRQMWRAAKGERQSSLRPVLDHLPRPDLGTYPSWTARDWNLQLRYAAGEQLGLSPDATSGPRETGPADVPPNPKGHQVGSGLLSARATCLDLLERFTYPGFVLPTVDRIRRNYRQRYFVGSPGQETPAGTTALPQASVTGRVVAGSLIGAGVGLVGLGLLGLALAGPLGALIGGAVGLVGGFLLGGLVGGLFGRRRDEAEATR
jgi:hypothetical protein